MKKIVLFLAIALAMLTVTGCANDDERFFGNGEGKVIFTPDIKGDINVVSRASATTHDLEESLILWVSKPNGDPIRKYYGKSNLPTDEWLLSGTYMAEAWAGDSVSASFTDRWFKGSQEFTVSAGKVTSVTVECKIANVLVNVVYAEDLAETLSEYSMTVGHKRGNLTFDASTDPDNSTGYFMMPTYDNNLTWTFTATTKNGDVINRNGVIENAKSATKYVLNVTYNPASSEIGGAYFDIEVDVTENEVYDEVMLELPPVVQGLGFDINQELMAKPGEVGRRSVFVTSSSALESLKLTLPGLSGLLGFKDSQGAEFDDIDLCNMDNAFAETVMNAGIQSVAGQDPSGKGESVKINFEESFTSKLNDGVYKIVIEATNAKGTTIQNFIIKVSNDPLQINDVNDFDIWATKATITATALREDCGTPTLQYRAQGSDTWIDATRGEFEIEITGLDPDKAYEYRVISDIAGGFESDIKTFTTESAAQLPNSGFESWNTSGKVYLLCNEESSMFWDSGNHGSSTMNKNITLPASDIKHSGEYSVKMSSQFVGVGVIGKFAAGNAFIGQYLKTDGTDGVLGWGRPFASRPKAIKGYVKYTPVAVTDANGGDLQKGDMDNGIIYIAILDGATVDAGNVDAGKSKIWPVVVKTNKSNRQLFSKDDANVIAYGEKVFTEATSGEGMIEFEIPIEYFKTDVKASNIMVTMSASRYGDYFTGGSGSTMWVDDLELVY